MSHIFGPGLQVNVGGEMSYIYFRVFDRFNNVWEPDCCEALSPPPTGLVQFLRVHLHFPHSCLHRTPPPSLP